jgi:hypothetical protein
MIKALENIIKTMKPGAIFYFAAAGGNELFNYLMKKVFLVPAIASATVQRDLAF